MRLNLITAAAIGFMAVVVHVDRGHAQVIQEPVFVLGSFEEYQRMVLKDPDHEMVDLKQHIPSIRLDIRYATTNNFTRKILYSKPSAYLRRPVADTLKKVHEALAKEGKGLIVFDAYRPHRITSQMWAMRKELKVGTGFLAPPWMGSIHNRGAAVDVSLYDLKSGAPLAMPTDFDEFKEKNLWNSQPPALDNYKLLKKYMNQFGFLGHSKEWWHYSYPNSKKFPVMDLIFE